MPAAVITSVMYKNVGKYCKLSFIFFAFAATIVLLNVIHTINIDNYIFKYIRNADLQNPFHNRIGFRSDECCNSCPSLLPLDTNKYIPVDTNVYTYNYTYRQDISYRCNRPNCTMIRFPSNHLPVTALASLPGSGNTWTRHLIQLITGKYPAKFVLN